MTYEENMQAEQTLTASILDLRRRFDTLYPGQKLVILSLPKSDPTQRARILARAVELLADR